MNNPRYDASYNPSFQYSTKLYQENDDAVEQAQSLLKSWASKIKLEPSAKFTADDDTALHHVDYPIARDADKVKTSYQASQLRRNHEGIAIPNAAESGHGSTHSSNNNIERKTKSAASARINDANEQSEAIRSSHSDYEDRDNIQQPKQPFPHTDVKSFLGHLMNTKIPSSSSFVTRL
jgi:hypothetical protein